jgi:hypothetical protein
MAGLLTALINYKRKPMNKLNEFKSLSIGDKNLILGHALICLGTLLVSIGTIFKMADNLPTSVATIYPKGAGQTDATRSSGGYFDL